MFTLTKAEKRFLRTVKVFAFANSFKPEATTYNRIERDNPLAGMWARVPLSSDWSRVFFFNGRDLVTEKKRITDKGGKVYDLATFGILYGEVSA